MFWNPVDGQLLDWLLAVEPRPGNTIRSQSCTEGVLQFQRAGTVFTLPWYCKNGERFVFGLGKQCP